MKLLRAIAIPMVLFASLLTGQQPPTTRTTQVMVLVTPTRASSANRSASVCERRSRRKSVVISTAKFATGILAATAKRVHLWLPLGSATKARASSKPQVNRPPGTGGRDRSNGKCRWQRGRCEHTPSYAPDSQAGGVQRPRGLSLGTVEWPPSFTKCSALNHCREQIKVLAKLVGAGSRLVDSIFSSANAPPRLVPSGSPKTNVVRGSRLSASRPALAARSNRRDR
jgi:hypothetical protein